MQFVISDELKRDIEILRGVYNQENQDRHVEFGVFVNGLIEFILDRTEDELNDLDTIKIEDKNIKRIESIMSRIDGKSHNVRRFIDTVITESVSTILDKEHPSTKKIILKLDDNVN
jgi:hypothetical protein